MKIDASLVVILSAIVSGLCSAITAIGIVAFTKRSDERRHLRELIMRTAVENWKLVTQIAHESKLPLMPLDVYLLHMLKFSEILLTKNITPDEIDEKIRDVNTVVERAAKAAWAFTATREAKGDD